MAKTEDWFGLAGVAWLVRAARDRPLPRRCTSRRATAPSPLVAMPLTATAPLRDAERAVDAAAGDQLPAGRASWSAAWLRTRARRPGPLVAGPAGLAVGDAARDVAGRAGDRGAARWSAWPSTARPARLRAAGRRRARRLGRRRRPSRRSGPSSTPPSPRSGRARAVLRRVGLAGLDELVRPARSALLLVADRRRDVAAPAQHVDRDRCSSRWPPAFAVYSMRTVPVAAAMIAPLAAGPAAGPRSAVVRRSSGASGWSWPEVPLARAGRPRGRRPAHVGRPARRARLVGPRALGTLPAGHQGARRLGPGRLPDVALPAARPDDARLRRHLHHRRAAPQHRL